MEAKQNEYLNPCDFEGIIEDFSSLALISFIDDTKFKFWCRKNKITTYPRPTWDYISFDDYPIYNEDQYTLCQQLTIWLMYIRYGPSRTNFRNARGLA